MTIPFSFRSGPHWFVVRSNIQCEFRAQMGLEQKGMRTYLPRLTKWVSHARRKIVVKRPLIRGYFFVELDPARQSFEEVRQTDGVELIIANCGIPSVVPSAFIEEFIRREMLGEFDQVAGKPLPERATVKIVNGEWDEFFGVVVGVDKGNLLVKLIGNRRAMKISQFCLRPAAPAA